MLCKSFLIHIYSVLVSWKNGDISGKIMEFDFGIWLETLYLTLVSDFFLTTSIFVILSIISYRTVPFIFENN